MTEQQRPTPAANAARFRMSPLVFWQRYQIAVDDEGIWRLPHKGAPIFIAWRDVATVRADDTMQRLELGDRSRERLIRIDYQLNDFERLREVILDRTPRETRADPAHRAIFYRTWINKSIILISTAPMLVASLILLVSGQFAPSIFFLGFFALGLGSISQDPLNLAITANSVVISYPGWKRTIQLSEIASVSLRDEVNRGNVWAAVVIARRDGKPIKLYRFREGSLALLEALDSALKNHSPGQTQGLSSSA